MRARAISGTGPRQTCLALRRRSAVEQRVMRLMRGDHTREGAFCGAQFSRLRGLAAKNDLAIQKPDAPFLTADELRLLGWLAQAQRVLGYRQMFHSDAMLTLTIVHCAGTLDAMGLHLPPLALCHAVSAEE